MSRMVMRIMRSMRMANPVVFAIACTLNGISRRIIFSIIRKSNLPPSSTGNGMRFNMARFKEMSAMSWIRYGRPRFPAWVAIPIIPMGPVTLSSTSDFVNIPVISSPKL